MHHLLCNDPQMSPPAHTPAPLPLHRFTTSSKLNRDIVVIQLALIRFIFYYVRASYNGCHPSFPRWEIDTNRHTWSLLRHNQVQVKIPSRIALIVAIIPVI